MHPAAARPAPPDGQGPEGGDLERTPPPILIGGRYALRRRLGVGGMGAVWRGLDHLTGAEVALKVLKPSIAGAPAAEVRFQREIQALARLNHPRIVPVIDAGKDPVVGLYFVMTLQQGRPLHEAARTWTHWAQAWPVVAQILDTLAVAHAQGVIHRDIKPDNILVDPQAGAVLLDFGVARLKDQARSGTSAYDMLGTVDYAAPEQATGSRRRIGPWTDLYCFGICLWELLCGRLPFWASNPVQSLMLRLDRSCPKLDPRPGLATPRGLEAVLNRLMQPNPFDRYLHAAELKSALAELAEGPYEVRNPTRGGEPPAPLLTQPKHLTDEEAERLLAKRQARYATTLDGSLVTSPLEAPVPPPPLMGRDDVLAPLVRGLDRWWQAPRSGVLILSGPMGTGKTRLMSTLLTPYLAAARVEGHCHRWSQGQSLREIALSIAGAIGLPDESLGEHLEWFLAGQQIDDAPTRKRLASWMRGQVVPPPADEGRYFARLLHGCTRRRPYVLWLDGLERLEPDALRAVEAVRGHNLKVIVAVTTREATVAPGTHLPGWVEPANRPLGRITDEALDDLLRAVVDLPGEDRAHLLAHARGNPKRLLDAVRTERRLGNLVPAWPRWIAAPPDWELPGED